MQMKVSLLCLKHRKWAAECVRSVKCVRVSVCVHATLSVEWDAGWCITVFVVDPSHVVFRFLVLIHFTTETEIWNAHNSFFWIGAELKKLTERGSSSRPEAHPPPNSPEPGLVLMATHPPSPPARYLKPPPSSAALTPGDTDVNNSSAVCCSEAFNTLHIS